MRLCKTHDQQADIYSLKPELLDTHCAVNVCGTTLLFRVAVRVTYLSVSTSNSAGIRTGSIKGIELSLIGTK